MKAGSQEHSSRVNCRFRGNDTCCDVIAVFDLTKSQFFERKTECELLFRRQNANIGLYRPYSQKQ